MARALKSIGNWLQSWPVFILMSAWLLLWAGVHIMPGRYWLDVRYIQAKNSAAGQAISFIVDREIRHTFYGEWTVSLRRAIGDQGYVSVPCGRGATTYRPDAALPNPVTLEWWTDGACATLPVGRYQISTQWIIYPGWLWPPKTISVLSNVFDVTAEPQAERQD